MMKKLIFIATAMLAVACTSEPSSDLSESDNAPIAVDPPIERDFGYDAAEEKACLADGGNYERAGLAGYFMCIRPYSDGGKICFDGRDCEGVCISDGTYQETIPGKRPPLQSGKCAMNDSPFGCYAEVVNGEIGPALCVD